MAIKKRRRGAAALFSIFVLGALFAGHVFAQDPAVDQAFERATQRHQNGDLQGAIQAYLAILEKYPARVDVRSNLGAAYSALGRYEDAIEQYKRALVINSGNLAIRFNLALAYYKAALFAEAVPELEKFTASAPNGPQLNNARLVLADCQVRLGEYKQVIQSLSPLAETDRDNRTLAYLLGSALIGDGQLDK